MSYPSWEPRHRVSTVAPGQLDLFVVTLINGERAAIDAVMEYDSALATARSFAAAHQCQVKVLPMTGLELRNLLGLRPPSPTTPQAADAADRSLVIETCQSVLRDGTDPDARRDAYDVLKAMGAPL